MKGFAVGAKQFQNTSLYFDVKTPVNQWIESTLYKCCGLHNGHDPVWDLDFVSAVNPDKCSYKIWRPAYDEGSDDCESHFQSFNFGTRKSGLTLSAPRSSEGTVIVLLILDHPTGVRHDADDADVAKRNENHWYNKHVASKK